MITEDEILERIYQLAKPYLAPRDGEAHVQIVLDFASRLWETRKGDREVIIPAVILHDTGRSAIPVEIEQMTWGPSADPGLLRLHEVEGMEIARSILQEVGYDSSKVHKILQIIDGHDTRANAISINDEIVRDADKLARYTRRTFWCVVEKFVVSGEDACRGLESLIDEWFVLSESKKMARKELKQRQKEVESFPELKSLMGGKKLMQEKTST
jgi:HD superfamily phosphohydrolase YqeK